MFSVATFHNMESFFLDIFLRSPCISHEIVIINTTSYFWRRDAVNRVAHFLSNCFKRHYSFTT